STRGISMPKKTVQSFSVEWLQILDENGNCDEALRPSLSNDEIKKLYEWMLLARIFDEKAFKLQREGRLGTYASILGQEAAQVGSALALRPDDWMFPAFREPGASIVRGLPMRMVLQYWAGDERGSLIPEELNDFPITIPVGTQIPIAVGAAWAAKLKGDKIAVMAYMGDGATSKGDFHEGLNFAGVFAVPVVFVCQNNQWAISVPLKRQTAAKTLAQKAIAYGFSGIQVDGNDPFAVYKATHEALDQARDGQGPTLIECVTYRLGDHTTADDASRYRSRDEVEQWRKKDRGHAIVGVGNRRSCNRDGGLRLKTHSGNTVRRLYLCLHGAAGQSCRTDQNPFARTLLLSTSRQASLRRGNSRAGAPFG